MRGFASDEKRLNATMPAFHRESGHRQLLGCAVFLVAYIQGERLLEIRIATAAYAFKSGDDASRIAKHRPCTGGA